MLYYSGFVKMLEPALYIQSINHQYLLSACLREIKRVSDIIFILNECLQSFWYRILVGKTRHQYETALDLSPKYIEHFQWAKYYGSSEKVTKKNKTEPIS